MDQRPDSIHEKKKRQAASDEPAQLKMASLIDLVFLLLVYFIITANFQTDEGTILATLPGNSAPPPRPDVKLDPPVIIDLASADDGVTYTLTVDGEPLAGVAELHAYLDAGVKSAAFKTDHPVQIRPQQVVRWQHVVNVFNACVRADMEQVAFAP